MNADAFSDLVLAAVCAWLFKRNLRPRPGVAVSMALIGLAACLGVFDFSGVGALVGPHHFTSLVAACAAFPLLAWSLRWPEDPVANRLRTAGVGAVLLGAIGVAASVAGVKLWGQVVPGAAAMGILWTTGRSRSRLGLLGAVLLLASFAATLGSPATRFGDWISWVQVLHYLLAAALLALVGSHGPAPVPRTD